MIDALPVGLPQVAATMAGGLAFFLALAAARLRRGRDDPGGGVRSARSQVGIAIQGLGIGTAAFGPTHVVLDPGDPRTLVAAAIVALLMAGCVGLFVWATRTMGAAWSIVARTRADHRLVTTGPFAHVRHPIYVALFLLTLALVIGLGHIANLIVALPLFAAGTALRVAAEERLLDAAFGAAHHDYAARVPRFVPRLTARRS